MSVFVQLLYHEQNAKPGQFLKGVQFQLVLSKAGLNSEFSYKAKRIQSALLFTHSQEEKRWIHAFPKGMNEK